jgi:hypothetical protein
MRAVTRAHTVTEHMGPAPPAVLPHSSQAAAPRLCRIYCTRMQKGQFLRLPPMMRAGRPTLSGAGPPLARQQVRLLRRSLMWS